jgi:hypothetical protein
MARDKVSHYTLVITVLHVIQDIYVGHLTVGSYYVVSQYNVWLRTGRSMFDPRQR